MKPALTRSDGARSAVLRDADRSAHLRTRHAALVADPSLTGTAFGHALAATFDETFIELLDRAEARDVAVVALGSYARAELCPGSDVDVLLLVPAPKRFGKRQDRRELAERLWYPFWDAGFVTGHGTRTVRDSITLADEDLDALTALLQVRHVAGDAALTAELATAARQHARQRSQRVVDQLAAASELRKLKPGPVAEMLEPNIKDGSGGLRDIQALVWAGCALGDGNEGLDALVARGALTASDVARLTAAYDDLLTLRVALHRLNGGRSDLLALQDQDSVAAALGATDADALVRDLATASRAVAWIVRDAWSTVSHGAPTVADRRVNDRIAISNGRLTISTVQLRAIDVLEAATAAAEYDVPFAAPTLALLAEMPTPTWAPEERDAFVGLLRAGRSAVTVFEALDHVGALVRIIPEWEHVRSLPQRNAYHRFTVDRHLLEAVAECATLLDLATNHLTGKERTVESIVARACRRPELLLLGALLHDIGKGHRGDHATIGATTARTVAKRLGLDTEGIEILEWLVQDHLLMAETATRRDLSDEATVRRFCDALAGDGERLRLLYLLTIGDSIATGPAAWSKSKASLLRDLFVKAAAIVESDSADSVAQERRSALVERIGLAAAEKFVAVMPASYWLAFDADVMVGHHELLESRELAVGCARGTDGRVVVTIAAPDRTGLLATVAGALTCCGLAVHEANLFTTSDGMALDVFSADDTYGRVADGGEERVRSTLARALAGELDVAAGVEDRRRHYQRAVHDPSATEVTFDHEASENATVVEVHAPDQVGLLYRLARTFAELHLDVAVAKVATLGDRVIDVFYVRDEHGAKTSDRAVLAALVERIRADT